MKTLLARFGVALLLATPLGTLAQPFAVDWYTIDGGGGISSGGTYTLHGTIGQPDAGTSALRGGNFTLEGGFWPGLAVTIPGGGPTLIIQRSGVNVIMSWSPDAAGSALEQADTLTAPAWAPAPVGNPVVLPVGGTARFYRLKKP
jgi:hypothetical protein